MELLHAYDDSWSVGKFTTNTKHIPERALETYYVRAMRKVILASGFYKGHYIADDCETKYFPDEQLSAKLPKNYEISLLDTGSCWCGYYVSIKKTEIGKNFEPTDNPEDYKALKLYLQGLRLGKFE